VPGLRIRSGDPFALGLFPLGRRPWTRTYRVEVWWNHRLLIRRRLRVTIIRFVPPRRVYADRDEAAFERCRFIEGSAAPPPTDSTGREYCVVPAETKTNIRLLFNRSPSDH
jgi:hypothetical protein